MLNPDSESDNISDTLSETETVPAYDQDKLLHQHYEGNFIPHFG